MSSKARNYRREFEAFMDAIAQSIEMARDEELLQEARDEGRDPHADASTLRASLLHTVREHRVKTLREARSAYDREVRNLKSRDFDLPKQPSEMRALLAHVFSARPEMQAVLTAQHRDLKDLSDSDIESCLKRLAALGVLDAIDYKR